MKRQIFLFAVLCSFFLGACGGGGGGGGGIAPVSSEGGANQAPVASNALITPASPTSSDALNATYDFSDADGDAENGTLITWYARTDGGAAQPQAAFDNQSTIPAGEAAKGQVWYFTVVPSDGQDQGEAVTSPEVTIANAPPLADAGLDQSVSVGAGTVCLNGAGSSDPDGDALTYVWTRTDSEEVVVDLVPDPADASRVSFTAPEEACELTFELAVSDGATWVSDTCSVAVVEMADLTSIQSSELLYAAHAGIGYMQANTSDDVSDDDEMLYNVMFDHLYGLFGELGYEVYADDFADDPENFDPGTSFQDRIIETLLENVGLPVCKGTIAFFRPQTFEYTETDTDGATIMTARLETNMELGIQPSGNSGYIVSGPIRLLLKVDFSQTAYSNERLSGREYTGADGMCDFEALIDGALTPDNTGGVVIVADVSMEAHSTLGAAYDAGFEVAYGADAGDTWNIAYTIDGQQQLNLYLVPLDDVLAQAGFNTKEDDTPDTRLYTLDGAFAIGGGTDGDGLYEFASMKYGQMVLSGSVTLPGGAPLPVGGTYLALNGRVNVPGFGSMVLVDSPGAFLLDGSTSLNITDPLILIDLLDAVRRDDDAENDIPDGTWISGELSLGNFVDVLFGADGSATLTSDSWTAGVDDWQDSLDPLP